MTTPVAPPKTLVEPNTPRVKWNVDHVKSSLGQLRECQFDTQEAVVLNFGMNNNWDRPASEVEFELTHRIVMSPFAARCLAEVMNQLVAQYEDRYGKMR